ncbi:MAG: TolC family protein [Pseudosphingobacterium sp.]|nr:TolC family protein [Pseudosphingobacterium sp.]
MKIINMITGKITKWLKLPYLSTVIFCVQLCLQANAQSTDARIGLSLADAIARAREANKLIGVARKEQQAASVDLVEAKREALPQVNASLGYQRYSEITLYEGLFGEVSHQTKPPNSNAGGLNVESSFNLYAGGRQKAIIQGLKLKNELAALNTEETEANIGLQTALRYLELVKIYYQQQVIVDQVDRTRILRKNIEALYANGKVTRSDLLRAEVLLSNAEVNQQASTNDYAIGNEQLNVLLGLDDHTLVIPSDTNALVLIDSARISGMQQGDVHIYSLLKIDKNIEIQQRRIQQLASFNLPSVSLFAGYGFNYPNNFFFPPQDQTVGTGMAGIKLSYNISSLYQNRNRISAARIRVDGLKQQKEWVQEGVQQEIRALIIKYHEALSRIAVVKTSIEQAKINYDIQNTKYLNQLSLLTDLLQADNLYQEARFSYIQTNINALAIYYRLLFVTGKIYENEI